jgi:hypothetical protein
MPSYNGTIRCSHCYEQGHNKRKCPRLTREIKEQYETQSLIAERYRSGEYDSKLARNCVDEADVNESREWNTNYHTARAEEARKQYLKRTKIDLVTGKKVTNKAAKAERMKNVKCGYCAERGHTRRVCTAVKQDYEVFKALSKKYRQDAYAKLQELNVNIGSMVCNRRWQSGAYKDCIYLVTGFNMSNVDYHEQDGKCVKVSSPQGHGDIWLSVAQLDSLIQRGKAHASASPVVLKPNALDGVKLIKEAFPTHDDRGYSYGRYGTDEVVATRKALGIPTPL